MPFHTSKPYVKRVFHVVTSNYVQNYRNGLHKNDHRGGPDNPVCDLWDEGRLELRFNPNYGNWKIYRPDGCDYPTWNKIKNWADDMMNQMDQDYKDFLVMKIQENNLFITANRKNMVSKMEKVYYDFIDEQNQYSDSEVDSITPPDTPVVSVSGTPPTARDEIIKSEPKEETVDQKKDVEVQETETETEEVKPVWKVRMYQSESNILTRSWADMDDDMDDEEPMMLFKELLTQSDPGIIIN
jgi:hypothetical protein